MNIVKNWNIKTESDNIFAKVELKNFCKHNYIEYIDFYVLALMELSTNLIKYTDGGNIWIVKYNNEYLLVSVDKGRGIKDINLAQTKGYTSSNNSLGLGLYQLKQHRYFDMEIYTSVQKNNSGTIVLLKPKKTEQKILFFSKAYMNLDYNGDYFKTKGRFCIFGDASGHGIKAQKSSDYIKNYFSKEFVSFAQVESFYDNLHHSIKQKKLRSSVMSVIEINKNYVSLQGVGNLNIFIQNNNKYTYSTFRNGIVGEIFDKSEYKEIDFFENKRVILTTDGFPPRATKELLSKLPKKLSPIMIAVCLMHFVSSTLDDSSILIINKG